MANFFINAIYLGTEGEGIRIGIPQVFVRFQGCSVGCVNCDSKYTWEFSQSSARQLPQVLEEIQKESLGKIKIVSLTGGDPLHQKHLPAMLELIAQLKKQSCFINVEAHGLTIVPSVFDQVDYISFDYKTPSTGVRGSIPLIIRMAKEYPGKFQLKSVVETQTDFEDVLDAYHKVNQEIRVNFPWCLTPAYNLHEKFPLKRFQDIILWNHQNGGLFRAIGQQHKWIYGPDQERV